MSNPVDKFEPDRMQYKAGLREGYAEAQEQAAARDAGNPAINIANDWCNWYQDGDETSTTWATSCGTYFRLDDGTPSENKMLFCYHCGKRVEESLFEDDQEPDAATQVTK